MPWNYRRMVKDGQFAVHEVFYDAAGEINGYTEEPVYPRADSEEELAEEFERYRLALAKPVLDYHRLEALALERRQPQCSPNDEPEPR